MIDIKILYLLILLLSGCNKEKKVTIIKLDDENYESFEKVNLQEIVEKGFKQESIFYWEQIFKVNEVDIYDKKNITISSVLDSTIYKSSDILIRIIKKGVGNSNKFIFSIIYYEFVDIEYEELLTKDRLISLRGNSDILENYHDLILIESDTLTLDKTIRNELSLNYELESVSLLNEEEGKVILSFIDASGERGTLTKSSLLDLGLNRLTHIPMYQILSEIIPFGDLNKDGYLNWVDYMNDTLFFYKFDGNEFLLIEDKFVLLETCSVNGYKLKCLKE